MALVSLQYLSTMSVAGELCHVAISDHHNSFFVTSFMLKSFIMLQDFSLIVSFFSFFLFLFINSEIKSVH